MPSVTVQRKAGIPIWRLIWRTSETTCGSSLLSTAMSGVRERMMAAKSRRGLSVATGPACVSFAEGTFIA